MSIILYIFWLVGVFIFSCVVTVYAILSTQDIRMIGSAALCWGVLLLIYCNYKCELKKIK
jgi:hypothetical protein